MRIVGLVPMRHTSHRVPGKNYRPFAGEPLYRHVVRALQESGEIDQIVIDTDSPIIMEDAARHFPAVRLIERPESLRAPEIPMNEVLLHDTAQCEADLYLQTHSTNPLLKPETIARAVESLREQRSSYDTLFSVTRVQRRYWDGLARPINHNPNILLPTQELPPIFEENSCIYLFDRETLERCRNRIGLRPLMFEIDPIEAVDIDEEIDFLLAASLHDILADQDASGA